MHKCVREAMRGGVEVVGGNSPSPLIVIAGFEARPGSGGNPPRSYMNISEAMSVVMKNYFVLEENAREREQPAGPLFPTRRKNFPRRPGNFSLATVYK